MLPPMARLMGIDHMYGQPLYRSPQLVTMDEWKKIEWFYLRQAPEKNPEQGRKGVTSITEQFNIIRKKTEPAKMPSNSFVKIGAKNKKIYAADISDSVLRIYNNRFEEISENKIGGQLVDIYFNDSMHVSGEYTLIGIMNPNDLRTGSVHSFEMNANGRITNNKKIFDSLPRPVQTIPFGTDNNGNAQYIICGFGNSQGALYLSSLNRSAELISFPGAIKAYTGDFNKDGIQDIITLMAQNQEGVFILYGQRDGTFKTVKVLSFPPVYGSSYFELQDFNKDGHPDIIYTCGDNADYTGKMHKSYHGVYIFLNDGKNNFKQNYFFPMFGCYKAMSADFDGDGDLDIACISYFPDEVNRPQESFIYLEQTGALQFTPNIIKGTGYEKWMTMDVGDADGDGDQDIILGSMVMPTTAQKQAWKQRAGWDTELLLLLNNQSTTSSNSVLPSR